MATVVKAEREKNPNLLLVDAGDYSQANYVQEFRNDEVPPIVKAMNYLKYDVSVLGNHEFNFEFKT